MSVKGGKKGLLRNAQWAPELLNELFVVVDFSNTGYGGPVGGVDVDEAHVYACGHGEGRRANDAYIRSFVPISSNL